MKTIIIWYRNDLRIHDHPALAAATKDADRVVPVFIFNDDLLHGTQASSNRNRFLLKCLEDLKQSLKQLGTDLVIRSGKAETELHKLAKDCNAEAIYYSADYTPYAIARDKRVKESLAKQSINFHSFGGHLIVGALDKLHTKAGTDHKVFTPFYKNWLQVQRRDLAPTPRKNSLSLPSTLAVGSLPKLADITTSAELSPDVVKGGEAAARQRLKAFIKHDLADYKQTNNDMAGDRTSRLSSYLHFGCLSPLEIETMLPDSVGAAAWRRQLCWREFYHYIIFKHPGNRQQAFQEKYRKLRWDDNPTLLKAWQQGQTGYPAVDAAMRQLNQQGWMHNRGRLIVGSFLTKDLWLNWQHGEAYFMKMLLDGDMANNNGNWQWIASIGVDPAPVYRRLYNPASQRKNFDPTGAYVRRFVPELKNVPDKYLSEPWTMPDDVQQQAGCIIGTDYPAPIVDHKAARQAALEHYRTAGA